ncbi:MAG: sortase [Roseiflexaceae bacterium]|nr:sortase [Roseiflexaceae bacterium]
MFRNWFDGLLQHSERLLAFAALLVFGLWAYDGPVRDWLHTQSEVPRAAVVQAAGPVPVSVSVTDAHDRADGLVETISLPFTTPAMANNTDEFIAPRPITGEPVVEAVSQPTKLEIAAIGLETPVREVFVRDGVWEVADYAAGYMHGTSLPGEPGTMALAGHAGLRGGVFRDLGLLQRDDDILVDAGGWRYRYRVRETFSVWPTQTDVLAATPKPTLVLITCTNWDTQRLIVRADLVESKPIPGT